MRRPDLPAKNDNAICLIHRVIVLRGQASLLQGGPIHCGNKAPDASQFLRFNVGHSDSTLVRERFFRLLDTQ